MSDEATPKAAESPVEARKRRRRRLTFGLRGFMVVVLILGLVCQWIYKAKKQHEVVVAIEREGGYVYYPWNWEIRNSPPTHSPPPFPRFLTKRLPDDCFGPVVAVHLMHREIDPRVVRRVAHFRELRELIVAETPIDDEDLLSLAGLTDLEQLELFLTKVEGPGLRALANMTKLTRLELHVNMADNDFAFISKLAHLKTLRINAESLTDGGLSRLAGLHEMETLSIYRADKTTDAGFAFLAGMPSLTDLKLEVVNLSDLSYLRPLKKLGDLTLVQAPIDDTDLKALKDLPQLRVLQLTDVPITDAGLVHLEALDRLETLILTWDDLRGPGLRHLARMKGLRMLALDGNPIGDDSMDTLSASETIDVLRLQGTKVTGAGLLKLKNLKSLKRVDQPDGILDDDNIDYYREQLHGIELYY